MTLVCLERTHDPDGTNHTGYDYWGAYGEAEPLNEWHQGNPCAEEIERTELPSPVTFYPEPFSSKVVVRVRARHPDGTFMADDPSTPENEAWIEIEMYPEEV